jgi:hypothetical protein
MNTNFGLRPGIILLREGTDTSQVGTEIVWSCVKHVLATLGLQLVFTNKVFQRLIFVFFAIFYGSLSVGKTPIN